MLSRTRANTSATTTGWRRRRTSTLEAGSTSQGTSALEAEGKVEIKSQALQGAEDKAKLVSDGVRQLPIANAAAREAAPSQKKHTSPTHEGMQVTM